MAALKKILVAFDGSNNSLRAMDKAIQIAKPADATITAVFVIGTPVLKRGLYNITNIQRNVAKQKAEEILGRARGRAKLSKVKFQSKIISGVPSTAIIKFATNNKPDILVVGARGLSGAKAVFLGSVSNHILHEAKVPVLVVK